MTLRKLNVLVKSVSCKLSDLLNVLKDELFCSPKFRSEQTPTDPRKSISALPPQRKRGGISLDPCISAP